MTREPNGDRARPRVARATWRIDVSDALAAGLPASGSFELAIDVVVPLDERADRARLVFVALPGGFLSRRYFDLDPGGDERYSFAEAMAGAGFATLAIDHPGTGDSDRPEPVEAGYALGVEQIARLEGRALERALAKLAEGDPVQGIPATVCAGTIGVGHSMGSMLTVEQQALARPHRALALFSFTTRGLPRFLTPAMLALAGDPARARRELGRVARETYGTPYPPRANGVDADRRAAFGVGTAPPLAEELLHGAATNLLGLGGLLSMIPGGYAPAAERIDVPVWMLVGDHDLQGTDGIRAELPKAPAVEIRVLPDCWHCHFVANTRDAIWRELPDWVARVVPLPGDPDRARTPLLREELPS